MNNLAGELGLSHSIADPFDGKPNAKPGYISRHREPPSEGEIAEGSTVYATHGTRGSRILLQDDEDPWEYSAQAFRDPLPVVPPAGTRVQRMLDATTHAPEEVIGLIPPCYGSRDGGKDRG